MTLRLDRDQMVEEMAAARAGVLAAIEGLTDEAASRPAADGWSVKDQLNHITFWHEMRYFEVCRIGRGGRASFPLTDESGVQHLNEQLAANRRRLSLEQVVADLEFAREMVKQALLAAPEDMAMTRFEEIGPIGAGHEMDHAGLIRAWRKEQNL